MNTETDYIINDANILHHLTLILYSLKGSISLHFLRLFLSCFLFFCFPPLLKRGSSLNSRRGPTRHICLYHNFCIKQTCFSKANSRIVQWLLLFLKANSRMVQWVLLFLKANSRMSCFSTWAAAFSKANSKMLFFLKSGSLPSIVAVNPSNFFGAVWVHHAFIKIWWGR